ncbi:DUF6907 domain-containing protein [Streptomyces indicus]|uniref:Uncharacterized protein n=1 Tax=Streptomyces indicus TaxID=417292 RepID=A0A1G9ITC8_9ACTN|nr:hypothetical protein [Streptomyces indicus]SDL28457.1 hypothetical protein SAMN05421806_12559 [Streptomyces indicus]
MSSTLQTRAHELPVESPPASRIVPALVAGSHVHIECPSWCSLDHVAENEGHLVDVHHRGATSDLIVPTAGPEVELLLSTYLWSDAFSTRVAERAPVVVIDDGSEGFHLSPAQAVLFAARVEQFAARIRDLASAAVGVPA